MKIEESSGNKAVNLAHWFKKLLDRFIKLPVLVKILLLPVMVVLFFVLGFPALIIWITTFKVFGWSYSFWLGIIKNRRNIALAIETFLLFLLMTIPLLIFALIFFVIYLLIIPLIPIILMKILFFLILPYLFILLFLDKNEMYGDIGKSMFLEKSDEMDILTIREKMIEKYNQTSKFNPVLWMMKSRFTFILVSSVNFVGGILLILLGLSTLHFLFPDVFFHMQNTPISLAGVWFKFLIREILNVIPVDFLGPFLPEHKTIEVLQPWGGICLIFVQIFIFFMLLMVIPLLSFAYQVKKANRLRKSK